MIMWPQLSPRKQCSPLVSQVSSCLATSSFRILSKQCSTRPKIDTKKKQHICKASGTGGGGQQLWKLAISKHTSWVWAILISGVSEGNPFLKCVVSEQAFTPVRPNGQCPYGNNTFQKGASLSLPTQKLVVVLMSTYGLHSFCFGKTDDRFST